MPFNKRLKTALAIRLSLLILAVVGVIAFLSVRRLRVDQSELMRAEQVSREVSEVASYVKDAETGHRGYLITRDPSFLDPYWSAIGDIREGLADLDVLVSEPDQQEDLERLTMLAERRLFVLDSVLDFARRGDFAAAAVAVRDGPGTDLMNEIRATAARMQTREFRHVLEREESMTASTRTTVAVVLVAGLLAVAVVGYSRQRILEDLFAREKAEAALAASEAAVRSLYEIAASPDLAFDQKLDSFLAAGRSRLGLSTGIVARVSEELFEVVAISSDDLSLNQGDILPVHQTFCSLVVRDRTIKGWESSEAADRAAYDCSAGAGVQSYIGAPIVVNGEITGVLSFSDARVRAEPFSQSEKDFVALTSQWIGGELIRREAEQAVRESEQRFRRLSEASFEGILVADRGMILDANAAFASMVGVPVPELIGRPTKDFVTPESMAIVEQRFRERYEESYEVVGLRADGTPMDIAIRTRLTTYHGRPARVATIQDITEQKRASQALQESEERYRSLVEMASDIIYRTDIEGHFTYVNPIAVQIMGFPEERLVGMHYTDLIRVDAREAARDFYLAQVMDGVTTTYYEFPAIAADGREVWIGQNVRLLKEGGQIVGAQAVARDVTRQREVERLKDEFLSIVSHELRTPLTAIRGSLGLVASGKMGQLEERGARMLEIAAQNTDRLVRLINDLLDIEKMESGKATLEIGAMDMGEAMRRAGEGIAPIAEKAGVQIAVDPLEVTIDADYDRIEQVLTNLLSNAVKFSVEGGTVWLGGERRENDILLWVRDEGRGIPADKVNLIFERFQQVDSTDSRQKGGTGLGLPIAKSIVQQHSGQLWVESRLGEGSTFFLTLPLRSESAQSEEMSDAPLILLVDDDPGVIAYVRALLQRAGYEVAVMSSGLGVAEAARERRPAAILLDLGMPGMSGAEVVAELRKDPTTVDVPVVVLTGAGGDPRIDSSEIMGWVEKPIESTKLLDAIDHASGRRNDGYQVLVVEDDEDVSRVISEMIAERGLRGCSVRSGREAIDISRKISYDLLLLDPGLPDVDGFEIIDWLRRHARYQSLPVIVYSARELSESERSRLRLGHTEFLVKTKTPVDVLGRRIDTLLEESRAATTASAR